LPNSQCATLLFGPAQDWRSANGKHRLAIR
jgi:hypothetical protein